MNDHDAVLPGSGSASGGLLDALELSAPGGVSMRSTDRLAYAQDASHFRLVPEAVVTPRDARELAEVVRVASMAGVPLTFRSGGTSLSGQAVGSGVLVDTRRNFRDVEVLNGGRRVRVQPGATLRHVNARLAPYGTILGPDPASEVACTIGGVVANNSSGMTCGIENNAYHTLDSVVLVLPSGTVVDTGAPDADERLRHHEPAVHEGLLRLRDRVRSDADSRRRIERQYAIKNTMGYALNALVEREVPARILQGLAVGSEGTLAFIAEATFRTLPLRPHAATGLLLLDDLRAANSALPALIEAGLTAIELLDTTALRVAQGAAGAPAAFREARLERQAGLLIEHQESNEAALRERVEHTQGILRELVDEPVSLTRDAALRRSLWHIRKGLYAAVAGSRPGGTTALLEDIAVPPPDLTEVCERLEELFHRHGYEGSVIFGHAKDGNVHFMLNERFDRPDRLATYECFTEDMVELVLGHGGTLKAEHGTGRVMAPFVRRQFGDELYEVMVAIKRLCDPDGVLNPGVILNDDPKAHLRHIKPTVTVEPEVDRCVSCGFCEPVCPSRDLTLTPRQRILLRREHALAESAGDGELAATLRRDYLYDGLNTCAVDGMCQTACPVDINTGDLVQRLRAERVGPAAARLATVAARHWDGVTRALGAALTVAAWLPAALPRAATRVARALFGADRVPLWDQTLPAGGRRRRPRPAAAPVAVYFPSCTGTLFGPAKGSAGVHAAILKLCDRAGVEVAVPSGIAGLCCGTPWKSKGLTDGYAEMRSRVRAELAEHAADPNLPIVVDASSCTEGLRELLADDGRTRQRVVDVVEFVRHHLLPRLAVQHRLAGPLAIHPTCSSSRLGVSDHLLALAEQVAEEVVVPHDWSCCAFAGDRGLLHPELTASAVAHYAASVRQLNVPASASCNRTCEIGMTRATGYGYRHIVELVEEATRSD